MHNKRPRLNLLPPVYVEFCVSLLPPVCEICKLTWIMLKMSTYSYAVRYYTAIKKRRGLINTHICRIKGCGGAGCPPPPIIFERLKLPQQIIYRRKENLSESPNHQKYWENILVSRFYEQFSRNRQNLGHFRKFEKISNS